MVCTVQTSVAGSHIDTWGSRIEPGIVRADMTMQRVHRAVGACRDVQSAVLHSEEKYRDSARLP